VVGQMPLEQMQGAVDFLVELDFRCCIRKP
jgi:hypothetical protein